MIPARKLSVRQRQLQVLPPIADIGMGNPEFGKTTMLRRYAINLAILVTLVLGGLLPLRLDYAANPQPKVMARAAPARPAAENPAAAHSMVRIVVAPAGDRITVQPVLE